MATIMVVEDSTKNVELMVRFLKRGGFETLVPANAAETLEMARTQQPDVILMDLGLNDWSPPSDGFELTAELREITETKETPIICVSAHGFEHEKERARKAGCDEFVEKPVNYLELIERLKELVSEDS